MYRLSLHSSKSSRKHLPAEIKKSEQKTKRVAYKLKMIYAGLKSREQSRKSTGRFMTYHRAYVFSEGLIS